MASHPLPYRDALTYCWNRSSGVANKGRERENPDPQSEEGSGSAPGIKISGRQAGSGSWPRKQERIMLPLACTVLERTCKVHFFFGQQELGFSLACKY